MSFVAFQSGAARPVDRSAFRLFVDLVAYGLVSVAALACDYGLLLLLVHAGMYYLAASTISFSMGMVLAYALSVRFVFRTRRGASRRAEVLGFFAVGLLGLLLTQAMLYLFVSRLGFEVALAKVPTTGVVFLFNFFGRRGLVFARGSAG